MFIKGDIDNGTFFEKENVMNPVHAFLKNITNPAHTSLNNIYTTIDKVEVRDLNHNVAFQVVKARMQYFLYVATVHWQL